MDKGGAAIWRQNFLEEEEARQVKTTWDEFKDALKNSFEPKDEIAIGIEALKDIRQGQKLAEDHNLAFKALATRTKLAGEPTALINMYQESLNWRLLQKLLSMENPPTTIEGWYNKAAKADNNYRRMQTILNRSRGNRDNKGQPNKPQYTPRYQIPRRNYNNSGTSNYQNPDNMDTSADAISIDAMTPEERTALMRKGACFNCKQTGHMAKDCPRKRSQTHSRNYNPENRNNYRAENKPQQTQAPKKQTGKETYNYIRAMLAEIDPDEREITLNLAAKEGF